MSIKVLSIFSGGGGIDCGFKKAGYDICFSTDFWKPACDTLERNKVGRLVRCADIRQVDYAKELAEIFPSHIKVGLLHGKMKNEKKNEVMEAFTKNEIQILVSTTVVEVGVNVPNATVMMIEDANRFGLAQLHQLRGRVGRGDAQSYCIMINASNSKTAAKRLDILNKSNDGFFIASEDLKFRGPGDFFGVRQSGELAFQIGDIYQDAKELQQASESVKEILEKDFYLQQKEHLILKLEMERFAEEQMKKMSL